MEGWLIGIGIAIIIGILTGLGINKMKKDAMNEACHRVELKLYNESEDPEDWMW
jgi:hypothetical protein